MSSSLTSFPIVFFSICPVEEVEVNLSHVPVCSRHLEAIDSLIFYGLFNTSNLVNQNLLNSPSCTSFPFNQLIESKRAGLAQLERCLFYLHNLTRAANSSEITVLSAHLDQLIAPEFIIRFTDSGLKQRPGLWACLDASKRLELALHQPHDIPMTTPFQYSVSRLFIAFQYRERQRLRAISTQSYINSGDAHDLAVFHGDGRGLHFDPLWRILTTDSMVRHTDAA
ncbi:unnamed protein product [Echinostoma caproni]|uniref:Uncharacterized protein n=1 Tax=Echinostoma caproni TaxID=27848 RepID=A0A183A3N8_9TREM|nr:unnamed protein product [Echinostoma caproni]